MLSFKRSITTFALFGFASAHAVLTISLYENGGDVVLSGSGSLDLTGMAGPTPIGTFTTSVLGPNVGLIQSNSPGINLVSYYTPVVTPGSFGAGVSVFADSATGDFFSVTPTGELALAPGYSSLAPLNFSSTFNGATLSSLGVVSGTYVWNLPSDSVVLTVVPEPSTYIALAGFVGLGLFLWRRRQKSKVEA